MLLQKLVTLALFWQAGLWVSTAVAAWLDHRRRVTLSEDKAVAGSIGIIRFVARVVVWAMVLLLTLDNLGVDITALVAGLGIGGIAVALALQNVLGDLLASLSIALDQPFVLGDFLIVGEHLGTRRAHRHQEHAPAQPDRRADRDVERRPARQPPAQLRAHVRAARGVHARRHLRDAAGKAARDRTAAAQIVEAQQGVRFERAHFATYGPYSLDFEVVYHVLSPDFDRHMDAKQAINFRIHEAFEALGVEFAYPTQTLSGRQAGAQGPDGRSGGMKQLVDTALPALCPLQHRLDRPARGSVGSKAAGHAGAGATCCRSAPTPTSSTS